ncbi:hypothetical protein GCM10023346_24290 [Arthrobacter gyeryongensis]|uniref:Uncharacterized protein n=1 Tax=Arthrobacter gyeryongensis TaxID=1650592 RepID=A0ABP9SF06_9MICC
MRVCCAWKKECWTDYWDHGLAGTAFYFLQPVAAMPERAGAAISSGGRPLHREWNGMHLVRRVTRAFMNAPYSVRGRGFR